MSPAKPTKAELNESADRCPLCSGTGWRMVPVERNGRTVEQATRCECILRQQGDRLLEAARIPRRYRHCELSNFEYRSYPSLTPAFMAAQRFVNEYPIETAGLLLTGPVGCGKTHLAIGIARELIVKKNVPCLFFDYRELLKEIQNSWNSSVQATEMEVLRPIFNAEVLILDELGSVRPTEWVWDTVAHILNTRYNDQRTTIFTTNQPDAPAKSTDADSGGRYVRGDRQDTLGDRISDRMRSRLHEMCRIVRVEGEDFRMKIKSQSPR